MNPKCHMQTTYKQAQIPRNVKLIIRVVTLIVQTQGYQQNKQVQLAQTQKRFFNSITRVSQITTMTLQ
jgi:hypothetical protein